MSTDSPLTPKNTQAYIDALLARLGDRDPLDVFAETPHALETAVEGLDDEVIRVPEAEGKWSVLEVVQHLADGEYLVGFRVRMTLAEDRPELPIMDQDAWAQQLRYNAGAMAEALEQFRVLRYLNLRFYKMIPPERYDRVGRHRDRGDESIGHMFRLYAAHDLYHLEQIERIKKAVAG